MQAVYPYALNQKYFNKVLRRINRGLVKTRTRGGAVGWSTALQAGMSRVRFPIFHWHNPSGRIVVLGST